PTLASVLSFCPHISAAVSAPNSRAHAWLLQMTLPPQRMANPSGKVSSADWATPSFSTKVASAPAIAFIAISGDRSQTEPHIDFHFEKTWPKYLQAEWLLVQPPVRFGVVLLPKWFFCLPVFAAIQP